MKWLLTTLTFMALPLAMLSACGDSDSPDQPTPTPSLESPTPAPAESPTPAPTGEPSPTPTTEPVASPTNEPVPSSPGHALGTRTGVPAIDAFLDALERGHVESVGDLLAYRPIPCVPPETAEYSVACPDGVTEGTPVSAFVYSACHGSWAGEAMRDTFAQSLVDAQRLVHSVYSTPGHSFPTEVDPPVRDIALLMVDAEHDWYSVLWFNDAGDLTDISLGCGHDLPNAINVWGLKGAPVLLAAP